MTQPVQREEATVPPAALAAALRALPGFAALAEDALEPIGFTGMAHDHLRIRGRGLVLRVPRVSQWAMPPEINLAYQAACFRRAAPSGRTPRLDGVLPPGPALPMGALVVEEIRGRKPRFPAELPALAEALRRIHALPLPAPEARRPLLSPADGLAHLVRVIELQAEFLPRAGLAPEAAAQLADELLWARGFAAETSARAAPLALIVNDSHPGNFLVRPDGAAAFVDLEKAMYGLAPIDLAHATLYTSTRFDPEIDAALGRAETAGFYRAYLDGLPPPLAEALRPWLLPLRRLVWLRTTTWCAKWRVESEGGGGWSRAHLDARTRAHTESRIADFLSAATIARIRAEWGEGAAPLLP
jgi:hypothetical protein